MDHLTIGCVETNGVSGIVSVGRTAICGSRSTSKSAAASGSLTGDFGTASVWLGLLQDADLLDAPVWLLNGAGRRQGRGGFGP